MRKTLLTLSALFALLVTGCKAPNVSPALAANAAQKANYHLLGDTFISVILKSKESDELKQKAVADIKKLLLETDAFNGELDGYLKALGEYDLDQLIELGKKLFRTGKDIIDEVKEDGQ